MDRDCKIDRNTAALAMPDSGLMVHHEMNGHNDSGVLQEGVTQTIGPDLRTRAATLSNRLLQAKETPFEADAMQELLALTKIPGGLQTLVELHKADMNQQKNEQAA